MSMREAFDNYFYKKVHPDAAGARKEHGEQSIGRSKGGLQQRYIMYVLQKNMLLFSVFHLGSVTMLHKAEN